MLHSFSGFLVAVIFTFVLVSCARVEDRPRDYGFVDEVSAPNAYAAWNTSSSNKAVEGLLQEADALMKQHKMEKASDKLERLLSIDSASAQAWSRLSWIALQDDNLSKTKQMAQRSNSYATDNQLKILNWLLIRKAAQRSGDVAAIRQAEQMVDSLGASRDSL